jgi:hypothetical protein
MASIRGSSPVFPPIRSNGPSTQSNFTQNHSPVHRRNSVGVLREQVLIQAATNSQITMPTSIELKLTANINASKFNRRRYPTQNEYEYLSPQPIKNEPMNLTKGSSPSNLIMTKGSTLDLDNETN